MIARRLSIDPALLVSMFSRTDAWRAVANRLPEDARVVQVESSCIDVSEVQRYTVSIWITSSVFREDDPVDLPAVELKAMPWMESAPYDPLFLTSSAGQPRKLSIEECRDIEAKLQALVNRNFGDRIEVYDKDGKLI
jgi:hypothetical protein